MKEITITKREEGQRFDKYLGKYLPGASSGFLHKMLRKKNIKLNGKKAEGREKLAAGDLIQIFFSDETLEKFQNGQGGREISTSGEEENRTQEARGRGVPNKAQNQGKRRRTKEEKELREQVRVLYVSEDILVFHKPAGMLSQRAKASDDSLNDYLIDYCIREGILSTEELAGFHPSIANRLDRNTSGIVLAGISIKGLQMLSEMLRERTIGKYYLCLVEGRVKEDARIAGYLTKEEKNNKVTLHKEHVEGASYIETEYKVLKSTDKASLLKIRLITGKSHQIRGHLASIGHPVFGDYKYGHRDFNNQIKWKDGINYQLLHSYELVVPEGAGALSGLHITDPVPEAFHLVQKRWNLEDTALLYENARTGTAGRSTATEKAGSEKTAGRSTATEKTARRQTTTEKTGSEKTAGRSTATEKLVKRNTATGKTKRTMPTREGKGRRER